MGLMSFNRMRRERAAAEKMEAARTKRALQTLHKGRKERDEAHDENLMRRAAIEKETNAASKRIGEKARRAIETGGKDDPLRRDHAAEIAGRNLHDVQQPKDLVDRVDERIPQTTTANEKLVGTLTADGKGPSAKLLKAAREEVGSPLADERREVAPHEQPPEDGDHAGTGEGGPVGGTEDNAVDSADPGQPQEPPMAKGKSKAKPKAKKAAKKKAAKKKAKAAKASESAS